MKLSTKWIIMITVFGFGSADTLAHAERIIEKTVIEQKVQPDVNMTDFSVFDVNGDGILSMEEVGTKLFYIFDTDGNEVIDNIEFSNKKVLTIVPMEKQVFTFIDYDGDQRLDRGIYTYDTFLKQTQLTRFDEEMDGLSPQDFIEVSYLQLDDDKSKFIELGEWREAYMGRVLPHHIEQERYNH